MDMLEHLRRLFAYDDWANREALASLRRADPPPARSLKLFGHILAAQKVWYGRIVPETSPVAVWPALSLDRCEGERAALARDWARFFSTLTLAGLAAPVSYKNSKGEPWTSAVGDILVHVAFHGAYHRAQIAADLRASGHEPAHTDFIHAVRQGHLP